MGRNGTETIFFKSVLILNLYPKVFLTFFRPEKLAVRKLEFFLTKIHNDYK